MMTREDRRTEALSFGRVAPMCECHECRRVVPRLGDRERKGAFDFASSRPVRQSGFPLPPQLDAVLEKRGSYRYTVTNLALSQTSAVGMGLADDHESLIKEPPVFPRDVGCVLTNLPQ